MYTMFLEIKGAHESLARPTSLSLAHTAKKSRIDSILYPVHSQ
jgi:hypothetical protein